MFTFIRNTVRNATTHTPRAAATSRPALENLEDRRLMSATTWSIDNGVWTINGDDANRTYVVDRLSYTYEGQAVNWLRITETDPTKPNEPSDDIQFMMGVSKAQSIIINAGNGNDSIIVKPNFGMKILAHGDEGNDTIYGGASGDALYGDAGDDKVIAGRHTTDNTLAGGDGRDLLHGGLGRDSIWGGAGHDTIYGDGTVGGTLRGLANDYLSGGADDDTINGGYGNDTLYGGDGNDHLTGDLFGAAGADYLDAGAGNDYVDGGLGADTVFGGTGIDFGKRDDFDVMTGVELAQEV
jgi:Ca2+-binding RTX toxin-like protein